MSNHGTTSTSGQASGQATGQLTGHEYDGIQEFDNPTPGWWHGLFLASVVFAGLYLLVWHFSIAGYSIEESWDDDQKEDLVRIFGNVGQLPADETSIVTQMSNPQFMLVAKATFAGNCATCHAKDGGGLVGVNLCDDYYKNVVKIEDLYRVISEGANNGAMPSWKNRLSQNERVILASYVASLRGTTPEHLNPPEGVVIPPWPKTAAAGSPPAGKK